MAQVHRATLRSDGREVAVKVQHLKVKKHSLIDIYTMDFLAKVEISERVLVRHHVAFWINEPTSFCPTDGQILLPGV